ncbi:hypothetical protein BCV70DRAFT_199353 [Testicularia cyperi]|uniref:SWR1-complex protein 4 n=1 Tax=Testicularia cyperi TaxID=1882483 RepID=A0A317XSA8_9BASI|nr:hypothetical protein BCV70DRAFT_199353 [Testicularia cyperi]
MTSNDVRDILSLPERPGSRPSSSSHASASSSRHRKAANPHPSSAAAARQRPKYEGITRELFALLGDNAPTLAMTQGIGAEGKPTAGVGAILKPKFKRKKEKARAWRWTPFLNPAREDTQTDQDEGSGASGSGTGELILHHWAPAKSQSDEIDTVKLEKRYRFADFNTSSGVYSYSNDEYIQHLRDEDWTKEETDYLMDLCSSYDLRFVVIHDRYDWASAQSSYLSSTGMVSSQPAKERSMEDLKARYYAICRRLIRSRISTEDLESRQLLLGTYAFDKQREVERKKALMRLYTRTPEQLAEEEALYVEIRRIEQNEAKYASEREELLRLLGGWESLPSSSPHAVAAAGSGIASLVGAEDDPMSKGRGGNKKRKLQHTDDAGTPGAEDGPSTSQPPASTRPSAALTSKQRAELRQAQFDEMQCIVRFPPSGEGLVSAGTGASAAVSRPPYAHLIGTASSLPPTTTNPSNLVSGHGVYLRSSRMLAPRPNLVLKTTQTLAESAPPVGPRLIFPTARNVEKWENLIGAVTTSLEMKKQLDRVNQELRIARQRIAAASGQAPQSQLGANRSSDRSSASVAPGAAATAADNADAGITNDDAASGPASSIATATVKTEDTS